MQNKHCKNFEAESNLDFAGNRAYEEFDRWLTQDLNVIVERWISFETKNSSGENRRATLVRPDALDK